MCYNYRTTQFERSDFMTQHEMNILVPKKAFEECSLLKFDEPDEKWLDFVAENRQGTYHGEKYDLVYGPVANDDVYRTITLYMTEILSKAQTLEALKIRKLYNQLVFKSEKSLEYLKFQQRILV